MSQMERNIRGIAHVAASTAINRYVGNPKTPPDYRAAIELAQDIAVRVENMNRDKCQFCYGMKGGVPGNENRIGGVIVCDYCHALYLNIRTS
jgi:hypothetical protein